MILKCTCCCSALEVEKYDEEVELYSISLWTRHNGVSPLSIKERIRWCWHILKTGNPWSDHTILSKEDFNKLKEFKDETDPRFTQLSDEEVENLFNAFYSK